MKRPRSGAGSMPSACASATVPPGTGTSSDTAAAAPRAIATTPNRTTSRVDAGRCRDAAESICITWVGTLFGPTGAAIIYRHSSVQSSFRLVNCPAGDHTRFMASAKCTAKDITVLEGLEPVRKRPGMYIGGVGSSGLHHLVWEILDNSIDEAMNGHASNITVTLHEDGSSVTIADDGRGIPVDKHSKTKKSAVEVIFTTLHAGGKFDAGNYKTAGGLHGVGASVVNALSKELVATVRRDGAEWELRFKQGHAVGALRKVGAARGTGSTVFFRPDATIFPKIEFDPDTIKQRLEVSSYLHKGLKIVFEDATRNEKLTFQHSEGLSDYLKTILRDRTATPVHDLPFTVSKDGDDTGMRLDIAL